MRAISLAFAVVLLCGTSTAFSLGVFEPKPRPKLTGTVLVHPSFAEDFTLTDQNNQRFHMADTMGKVVLLSFIYTHCTDICPYEAVKVKLAHDILGPDVKDVVFVAVTTDPRRDTPAVMKAYSQTLGLSDGWHFVGGPAAAVQKVWAGYGIGVEVDKATQAVAVTEEKGASTGSSDVGERDLLKGLSETDLDLVGKLEQGFGGGYDVGHSAPFWFVDKSGNVREVMNGNATPSEIARDIRTLLAE